LVFFNQVLQKIFRTLGKGKNKEENETKETMED
jgi:hypothetical protein